MKHLLRNQIKEKLTFLLPEERLEKSFQIMTNLFKLNEFLRSRTIAFFIGLQDEVETMPMIEKAMHLGKRIVLPVTDFNKNEMYFIELNDLNYLEETVNGLIEPIEGEAVNLDEIDLFVVPGVVFDLTGARIGKGKGFYDKILKKVDARIPFIALAFEFQLVDSIPTEEHDINVDLIVTEKRIIKCKK